MQDFDQPWECNRARKTTSGAAPKVSQVGELRQNRSEGDLTWFDAGSPQSTQGI